MADPANPALDTWAVCSISQGFVDGGGIAHSAGSLRRKRVRDPDLVWPSHGYPGKTKAK
jgi:hypothetical protein